MGGRPVTQSLPRTYITPRPDETILFRHTNSNFNRVFSRHAPHTKTTWPPTHVVRQVKKHIRSSKRTQGKTHVCWN